MGRVCGEGRRGSGDKCGRPSEVRQPQRPVWEVVVVVAKTVLLAVLHTTTAAVFLAMITRPEPTTRCPRTPSMPPIYRQPKIVYCCIEEVGVLIVLCSQAINYTVVYAGCYCCLCCRIICFVMNKLSLRMVNLFVSFVCYDDNLT